MCWTSLWSICSRKWNFNLWFWRPETKNPFFTSSFLLPPSEMVLILTDRFGAPLGEKQTKTPRNIELFPAVPTRLHIVSCASARRWIPCQLTQLTHASHWRVVDLARSLSVHDSFKSRYNDNTTLPMPTTSFNPFLLYRLPRSYCQLRDASRFSHSFSLSHLTCESPFKHQGHWEGSLMMICSCHILC